MSKLMRRVGFAFILEAQTAQSKGVCSISLAKSAEAVKLERTLLLEAEKDSVLDL